MSIDVNLGSSPLNVPLLNVGAVSGFLDTTLLSVETGSTNGNIPLIDTGAVAGKLDTTLLSVETGSANGNIPLLDTGAVAGKLDTTLLSVVRSETNITTTEGTTAGTIKDYQVLSFEGLTKSDLIDFSGYENDTTTNQVITFANAYTTFNGIVANTTGLTITLSLTNITITAPDSTTLFNGIINIQGV